MKIFPGRLTLPVDANAVAPALQGMREQGDLIFSKDQAAALLLVTVVLFDRIKMLVALLTDERGRLAIPQSCIGRVDGYVSELGILDERRVRVASNPSTCLRQHIVTIDTFHITHPATPR